MTREEPSKKCEGLDVYVMFLTPIIVTILLVFVALMEKDIQSSGGWQVEGGIFLEETIRPLMLSEELPLEYTLKELSGKKLTTKI